ncbi:RimJ/RimL family protein N-acetyltransferase [Streptacidiphilus sp. MAP12-16]|jgi:RimJ/RimL family protein N-acetyltransferase|uniref:GNAT family N-acetyltransferase n=1 Tax=Streptacidiphilus sp. MAP12-16 TaxID=3156300 RepID=UPI003516A47F
MPSAPLPTVLEGRHVRLEPLALRHVPDLFQVGGRDEDVWRWLSAPTPASEEELRGIVSKRLEEVDAGKRVAFAVVGRVQGTAIGTTNLHSWHQWDGHVEIGGTWFGRSWWRTGANSETKLLTMTYAFEALGFERVVWRVDVDNIRSQEAITRIGARLQECKVGALLKPDGTHRDLLVYVMLRDEWTAAKVNLTDRLARG